MDNVTSDDSNRLQIFQMPNTESVTLWNSFLASERSSYFSSIDCRKQTTEADNNDHKKIYKKFIKNVVSDSDSCHQWSASNVLTNVLKSLDLSTQDHEEIVESLGWNHSDFSAFLNNRSHQRNQFQSDSRDLCTICAINPINCILLPCGHYAICLTCGFKIDCCPFDRIPLTVSLLILSPSKTKFIAESSANL